MAEAATAPEAELDDATLAGRARDGDIGAYEQLVLRYQGRMFRLASTMLADRAGAEDVTQEVFLTAWRRIAQLRDDDAVAGWLYRMTTNRCLDILRARPADHADVDPGTTASPQRTTRSGHAAQGSGSSQLSVLTTALQWLPPEQRACWLLREVHGRSDEEIAEIVGTNTAAVRGQIARARAQLAEVLRPWR